MTDERVINRIKKLMALANDAAASDGERDNALRMAYATLAKYNLEMSDVEGKPTGPQETRKEARVEAYGRPWAMSLAHAVGRLFFCEYYYIRSWNKDQVFHCFVGKESNADSAAEVARVLIESVFREAKRRMRAAGENVTWRRSFCTGAMFKIQDRVRDLQASPMLENLKDEDGEEIPTPEAERKSTALVLVNLAVTEKEANKAWMAKHVGELKTAASRAKPTIKPEGYRAGRQFGESLSLTNTRKIK